MNHSEDVLDVVAVLGPIERLARAASITQREAARRACDAAGFKDGMIPGDWANRFPPYERAYQKVKAIVDQAETLTKEALRAGGPARADYDIRDTG